MRLLNNWPNFLKQEDGLMLIEFLVVLALMSILLSSGLDILGPSLKAIYQSQEREAVSSLIQEQFEVVRSIRNEDWNALAVNGTYHYEDVDLEDEGLNLYADAILYSDKYLVSIILSDVYRDSGGNIIESGDPGQIDLNTRLITVQVEWDSYGQDKNISQSIYLTNWDAF